MRQFEAGVKVPAVCQRHGISERTLYRWRRDVERERARAATVAAAPVGEGPEAALTGEALRVVVGTLAPAEQERAVRLVELTLRITRSRARQILGLDGDRASSAPRVGMALARRSGDGPLSKEFGKSRWLAVWSGRGAPELLRNGVLTGTGAADALVRAGCRDVIALHLGPRACDRLRASGLYLWRGVPRASGRELVARLARGELEPWPTELIALSGPNSGKGADAGAVRPATSSR